VIFNHLLQGVKMYSIYKEWCKSNLKPLSEVKNIQHVADLQPSHRVSALHQKSYINLTPVSHEAVVNAHTHLLTAKAEIEQAIATLQGLHDAGAININHLRLAGGYVFGLLSNLDNVLYQNTKRPSAKALARARHG
jgi:hypothetical protein